MGPGPKLLCATVLVIFLLLGLHAVLSVPWAQRSISPMPGTSHAIAASQLRPALGWSTWNTFRCNVSESLVLRVADALVASGLRDRGFKYVNIDDCWMARTRGPRDEWRADPQKFPRGMRWLADALHARGLKLGLYSSGGATTCGGFPGSYGHEVVCPPPSAPAPPCLAHSPRGRL